LSEILNSPLEQSEESLLVERAQKGDEEAFQELMRRTRSTSLRLALSIVKNREEAEDQVQTSFFKAWKNLPGFQREARFSTWLRTIVVNQSLMHLRSRRRAPVQALDDYRDEGLPLDPADTRESHEATLASGQMRERLRKEIQRLPPLFREVLELRDLQELPTEDVAQRLGISEAAMKSRLFRARQLLRQRLQPHSKGFVLV